MDMPDIEALSDNQIVQQVLDGKREAFEHLVRRHQRGVRSIVASLVYDKSYTEELTQEAFINAYMHLDKFRIDGNFAHWINGVARNLVRMHLRTQKRATRKLEAYRNYLEQWIDQPEVDEHEEAMQDALRQCCDELAPTASKALDLRYRQAASCEDIASEIGRSVVATRQLLSRVRSQLRDCVERKVVQA